MFFEFFNGRSVACGIYCKSRTSVESVGEVRFESAKDRSLFGQNRAITRPPTFSYMLVSWAGFTILRHLLLCQ